MKQNYIKKVSELRAGPYIRAYVNNHGDCRFDFVEVKGRPYLAGWCDNKKLLAVKVKTRYTYTNADRYYCGDLGATATRGVRLYPFSNKIWNDLKTLQDQFGKSANREFTEYLSGNRFTDLEWEDKMNDYEMFILMDKETDKMSLQYYEEDDYGYDSSQDSLQPD